MYNMLHLQCVTNTSGPTYVIFYSLHCNMLTEHTRAYSHRDVASKRTARTFDANNFDPNTEFTFIPCWKILEVSVNSKTSATNSWQPFSLNKIGQKYADGHFGIINAPLAFHSTRYEIHFPTNEIGGTNQLLSLAQFTLKQSTFSVPGFQNTELNLANFVFV